MRSNRRGQQPPVRRRGLLVAFAVLVGTILPAVGATTAQATTRNPVVLVAGLSSPAWALDPLQARLRNDGYNVTEFGLPGLGFGDIAQSAAALSAKVDQVRAATGAAQVDIVAHSEGGLVSRYWMKFLGGAAKVGTYVSLGTPQHGTAVANIVSFIGGGNCLSIVACQQMTTGSSFLANLNAGDETPGSVRYNAFYTVEDELVQPYATAALNGGSTNYSVQHFCWARVVGHLGLITDGTVYSMVHSALLGSNISANCWAL
jgi:triacylglycerol lipase